jgi:ABC-type spermidine/putrescine transport system permease subunit II
LARAAKGLTARHAGRTLDFAAGHQPALGDTMTTAAILACLAILLGTLAALALCRNGGAE